MADQSSARIEVIGGHRYWVVRDENGNIVRQEARDDMTAAIQENA